MERSATPGRDAAAELPPALHSLLCRFLDWTATGRPLAVNTLEAYRRDLLRYMSHLVAAGVADPAEAAPADVKSLLSRLESDGLSARTVARNLSSIRRFHRFLQDSGANSPNPTDGFETPKLLRQPPDVLTFEETERLLSGPNSGDPLGLRDSAILELLYATGLRVAELIGLGEQQLLLGAGLVRVAGKGARERLVPVGRPAVAAVEVYLREGRPFLAAPDSDDTVFLNAKGRPLSRMGLWKIIQAAARRAALDKRVSPHTLRHSFAAHLLDGGASLRDVQELLGHTDIATTQVYARIDPQALKEVHGTYHPRS